MQEAEGVALRRRQPEPVGPRRLQHGEGPDDVGLDEGAAAGDRAVDVAFGGQVDDVIGRETGERLVDRPPVADVDPGEAVVRRIVDRGEELEIAGVCQGVEVQDVDAGPDQMTADCGTDESRSPGDQHFARHDVSQFHAIRRPQQVDSEARHSGRARPYTRPSFPLSSRELAGRRAGVG